MRPMGWGRRRLWGRRGDSARGRRRWFGAGEGWGLRGSAGAAIASVEAKEKEAGTEGSNNILEYDRIGMMAQFDVGDFATARKYYAKFLAAYPRDQRAFNVRLMMRNMDETEAAVRAGRGP